jgi:hypothetical protein
MKKFLKRHELAVAIVFALILIAGVFIVSLFAY